jgi:uncharacterized protein YbjT (DUF2867 family)
MPLHWSNIFRKLRKGNQKKTNSTANAPPTSKMAPIQKVALAGATGDLGAPALQALLDAGFQVTALTRKSSTHTFPASVKVAEVNYDSLESLNEAIQGHDALISTITTTAIDQQKLLVDAAVATGVKRFIPSEFGCDLHNPKARPLPVYSQKVAIEEYVEQKTKGTATSYTYIFNNIFLDWGITHAFLIDVKNKKLELCDGGETKFTATPLPFVGKAVAAVLKHPHETANRAVRIQGTILTQKKLLEIAKRVLGEEGWEISEAKTEDLEKGSWAALKADPTNVYGWIIGFLKRAIFAEGYGGDFTGNNDNELLGLKELSEKDVEEIIREVAK